MRRHRNTTRYAAAVCSLLLVAAACGSDDDGGSGSAATSTSPSASSSEPTPSTGSESTIGTTAAAGTDDEAFPVSIEHQFGTAEIEAAPQRVVSVGNTDADDILALGVTPVGLRDWYGDQPGGLWPWATELAAGAPIEVMSSDEFDFEAIAALEPDVIIGISSGMTQADYDTLSAIAPTVAQSDEYIEFGTPWDVQQTTIGRALGLEDEAEALVDDVREQIAAVAADHPEWAGLSANVAAVSNDGSSFLYTPGDARGRLITDLGFTIPEAVTTSAGDLFYASASAEQITLLDADVLLYTTFTEADRAAVDALPLFRSLGVVSEGRSVYLDQALTGAMSFSTTLSIPYALDQLVPQLEGALRADAAPTTDDPGVSSGSGASGPIEPGADPDVDAVVEAYSIVFDSTTTYDQKAPFLPDAANLRATIDNYAAAGGAVGGIELAPTAVRIDGDRATVTYDVLFAGTAVYTALEGSAVRVDGAWTITKDEFCGFMSSARNPCS